MGNKNLTFSSSMMSTQLDAWLYCFLNTDWKVRNTVEQYFSFFLTTTFCRKWLVCRPCPAPRHARTRSNVSPHSTNLIHPQPQPPHYHRPSTPSLPLKLIPHQRRQALHAGHRLQKARSVKEEQTIHTFISRSESSAVWEYIQHIQVQESSWWIFTW